MLALALAPLSLCLQQPLRTPTTFARARPAVAMLNELPPGFETLMPAVVHHTPFSRHLFNAIMGYMAIDTTLFAAKIIKRRMEPGVQEAARLAAAPTTKFGADKTSNRPPRRGPQPHVRWSLTALARALAGWVQADLRGPLPPLEQLDQLRVGQRAGHTLHLCRADVAVGFASIERSLDFSEHYGASLPRDPLPPPPRTLPQRRSSAPPESSAAKPRPTHAQPAPQPAPNPRPTQTQSKAYPAAYPPHTHRTQLVCFLDCRRASVHL